jgi:hypothetical protein
MQISKCKLANAKCTNVKYNDAKIMRKYNAQCKMWNVQMQNAQMWNTMMQR